MTRTGVSAAVRRGIANGKGGPVPDEADGWAEELPSVTPGYECPDEVTRQGCGPAIRTELRRDGFPPERLEGLYDQSLANPGGSPGSVKNLVDFCWAACNA